LRKGEIREDHTREEGEIRENQSGGQTIGELRKGEIRTDQSGEEERSEKTRAEVRPEEN
jgi:hypothetical protein